MNDRRGPLRRFAPVLAVALVALALAGCSKKLTSVDSSYDTLEGKTTAVAQQVVYPRLPTTEYLYQIVPQGEEEPPLFVLVSTAETYPTGTGVVNGMVFDGSAAGKYRIFRRELGGGYGPLFDYDLDPVVRFPQGGWKLFTWNDGRPSGFDPPTYQGRGVVAGVVTRTTPLTNVSVAAADPPAEIGLRNLDSLRTIGYTPIPGAVAYIVQIYAMVGGTDAAAIHNASPAPFAALDHRDYYVAWMPATDGVMDKDQVKVLTHFAFASRGYYLVHMAAVDAAGKLIGFSYGDLFGAAAPEEYLRVFRGGSMYAQAFSVHPLGTPTPRPITFTEIAPEPRFRGAPIDPLRAVKVPVAP